MNVNLRKAVLDDANQLFELVEKFATSFEAERFLFLKSLHNLISDDSAFLYVAEYNNKIYGYCLGFDHYTFYANGRVAWLEEIMVADDYRKCKFDAVKYSLKIEQYGI